MQLPSELPTLLLVEDNPDDVFFLKRLFSKAGILNPIRVLSDGEKAMGYLTAAMNGTPDPNESAESPQRLPLIVFLDIKLPRRNGFEVLEWKRKQPGLQGVAAIMLTSSSEDRDVSKAYNLGAESYLVKYPAPADLNKIVSAFSEKRDGSVTDLELPGLKPPSRLVQ